MKTVLNIKTDRELKKKAQSLAKELGLPLSIVINGYLRDFVQQRRITFSAEELRPEVEKRIRQAELDYKKGINISPPLSTPAEMDAYLNSL